MIQVLKLTTGEEIVGEVTGADLLTVKNPCVLQMVPSRTNDGPAMALVPVGMHLEGQAFTIDNKHVLWSAKPVKELYNQYNSYFGTGIQLAGL